MTDTGGAGHRSTRARPPPSRAASTAAATKRRDARFGAPWAWVVFIIGVPVLPRPARTRRSSVSMRAQAALRGVHQLVRPTRSSGRAWATPSSSASSPSILSIALIVPTAYWVRLRVPRLRPVVEFVTLLPFVIPPVVLVFGLIRAYSRPPLPLTYTDIGSTRAARLRLHRPVAAVHVPRGRHGPAGDRHPDAHRGRPEPGRRLAHDHRPDHPAEPAGRAAVRARSSPSPSSSASSPSPSTSPGRPSGRTCSSSAATGAYEPAAVSLISFGLTWLAMIAISFVGRGSRTRIPSAAPADPWRHARR